jgi:hypothetical protein
MDARTLAGFLRRYGQEHIFWPTEPREPVGTGTTSP